MFYTCWETSVVSKKTSQSVVQTEGGRSKEAPVKVNFNVSMASLLLGRFVGLD